MIDTVIKPNILELRNITKDFSGEVVLKGISLNIKAGEFITLLGPSGCGKTTTLRIIGGFDDPNSGEILFESQNMLRVPIHKRKINTIFQNYALFPHLNVYENVAYGLKIKKLKIDVIKKAVLEALELVNLVGFQDKDIDELSGGQKQRVAIARALVNKPKVLLLDEPLAALDLKLRQQMQLELKRLQNDLDITFILVTHDQEEAFTMSDRIVVMNEGQIQQVGSPENIYNEPENKWTAKFVGVSNIIENAVFVHDNLVHFDGRDFRCLDKGYGTNETNIDIVIRPEDIDIVGEKSGYFRGTVKSVTFKGVYWEIVIVTRKRNFLVHSTDTVIVGKKVGVRWSVEDIHVMWKEVE